MEDLFTTKYDDTIKEKLPHLNNYPEMLPFVGAKYEKMATKIFILGESHYFDPDILIKLKEINNDDRFLLDWYNQNSLKFDPSTKNYINTKGNFRQVEVDSKFTKPLASYYNLRKELKENIDLVDNKKVFSNIVYFNYFQRPSVKSGQSIDNSSKDNEVAYETLLFMTTLLEPDKIIFATTKGWDAFSNLRNMKPYTAFNKCYIDFVPHASCKWWNTQSMRYGNKERAKMTGKEKFISLLKK